MSGFAAILVALGLHVPALPAESGATTIPRARVVVYQEQGLACHSCVEATLVALRNQDLRQPPESVRPGSLARTEVDSGHANPAARLIRSEGLDQAGPKSSFHPGAADGPGRASELTTGLNQQARFAGSGPSRSEAWGLPVLPKYSDIQPTAGRISDTPAGLFANTCLKSYSQVLRARMRPLSEGNRLRQLCCSMCTPLYGILALEVGILSIETGAQYMLMSVLNIDHEWRPHRAIEEVAHRVGRGIGSEYFRAGRSMSRKGVPQPYAQINNLSTAVPVISDPSFRSAGLALMNDWACKDAGVVFRTMQSPLRRREMARGLLLGSCERKPAHHLKPAV